MKKVLAILDSLCAGGREKIVVDTCNLLVRSGYDVTLVTLSDDNNFYRGSLNPDIHFFSLPLKEAEITGARTFLGFYKGIRVLKRLIKDCNPDVIHTHSAIHRLLLAGIAIKAAGVKARCFHSIHTPGLHYNVQNLSDKIKLQIERIAIGLNRPVLIAASQVILDINERFFSKCSSGSLIVPNGIDLKIFAPEKYNLSKEDIGFDKKDHLIVYPARLGFGKNHITLLKAMKYVFAERKDCNLLLLGDGEERANLTLFVNEHGLSGNVRFAGNVHNVPELLNVADIGVFPSEFEGFGIGLIEMMAMNLPVLASDIDTFKTIITHGENGYLFEALDEEQLAGYLLELVADGESRTRLGKAGRKTAEEYAIEKTINKLILAYEG